MPDLKWAREVPTVADLEGRRYRSAPYWVGYHPDRPPLPDAAEAHVTHVFISSGPHGDGTLRWMHYGSLNHSAMDDPLAPRWWAGPIPEPEGK